MFSSETCLEHDLVSLQNGSEVKNYFFQLSALSVLSLAFFCQALQYAMIADVCMPNLPV